MKFDLQKNGSDVKVLITKKLQNITLIFVYKN